MAANVSGKSKHTDHRNNDYKLSTNKVAADFLSDVSSSELSTTSETDEMSKKRHNGKKTATFAKNGVEWLPYKKRYRSFRSTSPESQRLRPDSSAGQSTNRSKQVYHFREAEEYRHHVSYSTIPRHNTSKRRRLTKRSYERLKRNKCRNRQWSFVKQDEYASEHRKQSEHPINNNTMPSMLHKDNPMEQQINDDEAKPKLVNEPLKNKVISEVPLDIRNIPLPQKQSAADVIDGKNKNADEAKLPQVDIKTAPDKIHSKSSANSERNVQIESIVTKTQQKNEGSMERRERKEANKLDSTYSQHSNSSGAKYKPSGGRKGILDLPMPAIAADGNIDNYDDDLHKEAKNKVAKRPRPTIKGRGAITRNDMNSKWGERCVEVFEIITKIGEGTYGQVSSYAFSSTFWVM